MNTMDCTDHRVVRATRFWDTPGDEDSLEVVTDHRGDMDMLLDLHLTTAPVMVHFHAKPPTKRSQGTSIQQKVGPWLNDVHKKSNDQERVQCHLDFISKPSPVGSSIQQHVTKKLSTEPTVYDDTLVSDYVSQQQGTTERMPGSNRATPDDSVLDRTQHILDSHNQVHNQSIDSDATFFMKSSLAAKPVTNGKVTSARQRDLVKKLKKFSKIFKNGAPSRSRLETLAVL